MKKTCVVIAGPTATGKTAIAIDIANRFSTEIISADSRQCYKELEIGVAKPTRAQLQAMKHYFINSHSIHESVTAASFEAYALNAVQNIFLKHDVAVMVGGTGLYIKAFCEGLDFIPAIDESVRKSIIESVSLHGIGWLRAELKENDPVFYEKENSNPQRMIRALEVKLSTGTSIIEFQNKSKIERDFNIVMIGLEMDRQILYNRINQRVDDMIANNLESEARVLWPFAHLNALQTVGYSEFFEHFNGSASREETIARIKQNTRHYAKRQMTWFKRQEGIKWFSVEKGREEIEAYLESVISSKP